MQLGHALSTFARNVLDTVVLRRHVMREFKGTNVTQVAFPRVTGAEDAALEAAVVTFMRTSKKQRGALDRRNVRLAARADVEERRAAARAEKQAEVELRRELRKAEAEASVTAKRDAKGKGKNVVQEQDLDVDPADKCGISSPVASDDDGDGEDSQDEEAEEAALAMQTVVGDTDMATDHAATVNIADAVAAALGASELGGAEEQSAAALLLQSAALRVQHEETLIGHEKRQALISCTAIPPPLESSTVAAKWALAVESAPADDAPEVKKAAAAKKGGKGGKGDVADAGAAAKRRSTAAVAPSTARKPAFVPQCIGLLEAAIQRAHSEDDMAALSALLFEYAQVAIMDDARYVAAGTALAAAHGAAMAGHVTQLWALGAAADSAEAANFRAVTALRATNPALARTPHFAAMMGALYSGKMFGRLRLPDSAVTFPPTEEGAAPAAPHALPNDVAVLTVALHDGALYAAFHRGARPADLRRVAVDPLDVEAVKACHAQYSGAKLAALGSMPHGRPLGTIEIAETETDFIELVKAQHQLLAPLLKDLDGLFGAVGPRTHCVVCLDAALQFLPVEALVPLAPFRSVSRDLSLFAVLQRVQRRAADKYSPAAVNVVVDVDREHDDVRNALFGSDEKPKATTWQLHTSPDDEQGNARTMSVAQIQKVVTQTNASTLVLSACGALPNVLPLDAVATVDLSHVRVLALLDRTVNAASTRRENQANMVKPAPRLWAELPWNVALLMLARGVDCCVAAAGPVASAAGDLLWRMVVQNLERPTVRHFAELTHQQLHKGVAALSTGGSPPVSTRSASVNAKKRQSVASDADAAVTALSASDRFNVVVYGVSPDESSGGGGGGGRGK
jgi:hypothetical protein